MKIPLGTERGAFESKNVSHRKIFAEDISADLVPKVDREEVRNLMKNLDEHDKIDSCILTNRKIRFLIANCTFRSQFL